jgi:ferric-dicitrate binding protein FerR (iron transport regulator)
LENSINHIDDLIGKYLSGETSADEKTLVEKWVAERESNQKYFDQFKLIFDRAATVKEIQDFNTDDAWNKLKSRLNENGGGRVVPMKPFWDNLYLKIAASIIFVMGVGFFLYRSPDTVSPVNTVAVVTDVKIKTDTLPDGSTVTLNKKTQLAYSFDKKERAHHVKLKGEAYFDIEHKNDKIFIVETDQVLIKDIGTKFNVKAYAETNTIEVVVEEGEVQLYTSSSTGIFIKAGGKGTYNKTTKEFSVEQPEANVAAYKSKHFIFSDTELGAMILSLNNVYDRKIKIAPHLAQCRLTVTFYDESPEEIANVIAETLGLSVTAEGLDLLLEGKACEN